jgi:hypothetical protein
MRSGNAKQRARLWKGAVCYNRTVIADCRFYTSGAAGDARKGFEPTRRIARMPSWTAFSNDEEIMPFAEDWWPPQLRAAVVRSIMLDAPPHDSDIIPDGPRQSPAPRHRALAAELAPLLEWRGISNPTDFTSLWCAPANDDTPGLCREGYKAGVECEREIRPSIHEIERALAPKQEGDPELTEAEKIAAWQALKKRVWPRDKSGTPRGPALEDLEDKRLAIANLKAVLLKVKGTPIESPKLAEPEMRQCGARPIQTAEKRAARDMLEEFGIGRGVPFEQARTQAWRYIVANDNVPKFPKWPRDPRAIFFAGKVRPHFTSSDHSEFGDGVGGTLAALQEGAHCRGKLPASTVKAMDAAICARNFAEVGAAFGYRGKNAERRGKQLVREACAAVGAFLES